MKQEGKLWNKNYILLILAEFLVFFNFAMESTTLSQYLVNEGFSISSAGIMVGAMSVAALLGRPFMGWLCDNYNKKRVFLIGSAVYAATVLGYTIFVSYYAFILLRILHGLAFGIVITLIMILLGENIPQNRLGEGMGIASIASSLAFTVGPNLAITIGNRYQYSYIFYVAALCAAGAGLIVCFIPYEYKKERREKLELKPGNLIEKKALIYAAIICVSSAVCGVSNSFVTIYGNNFAVKNIGWYFTVGSVFAVISKYAAGKIADKFGYLATVIPGIVLTILSLIILGNIAGYAAMMMFMAATVLLNLGTAGLDPVLQAKVLSSVSEERRGAAASTFYIGADLGQAVGPIAGGALVQFAGYGNMYLFFIIPLAVILVLLFGIARREKKNPA